MAAGKAQKDAASGEASSSVSSASSVASDQASEASETASSKVMFGANAQILVEAREPILDDSVDDDATYSERLQSILDGAADQASALTEAVADALKPSTSAEGVVESATSLASEQYEAAMAAASSVLFGPEKGTVESGTEAAKAQYESAVTA